MDRRIVDKGKEIFGACDYHGYEKTYLANFVSFHCNAAVTIYCKTKNQTLNEYRRDIFLRLISHHDRMEKNSSENCQKIAHCRVRMKAHNSELNIFFLKRKEVTLYELLVQFMRGPKWLKCPQELNVPVKNARFIRRNGNEEFLVAESDGFLYYAKYSGS